MQRRTTEAETTAADSLGFQVASVGQSEANRSQSYNASVTHVLKPKLWTIKARAQGCQGRLDFPYAYRTIRQYLWEVASAEASWLNCFGAVSPKSRTRLKENCGQWGT